MHRFAYHNGAFFCEAVRVDEVARHLGTPLYLYSLGTLLDHFKKLKHSFSSIQPLICFSMKANSSLALCRALMKAGAGFDVVSGGELYRALRCGASPKKIVYASVGKTEREIANAIRLGILFFNVESFQELEEIQRIAKRLSKKPMVSLRLNPDVETHTHAFISTGKRADKFGMDAKTITSIFDRQMEFPNLTLGGLHIHIGSQILEAKPFQAAIRKALGVIREARAKKVPIRWLNLGGGLGIIYHRETPQTPQAFAKAVLPLLKETGLKVILEPGRFIAGNSGILVTRVLLVKKSYGKQFAVVDAGMNDLIRPSLYGAYHAIVPALRKKGRALHRYDVVGPVCESGDFFAQDRTLPALEPGELLAILGAGAYGFTMASNYNSRPRPAEALVHGKQWHLIRLRERYQDLVRGERIPSFLR